MSNLIYQKERPNRLDLDEIAKMLNYKKKDGSYSLPSTGFNVTHMEDARMLDIQAQAQTRGLKTEVLEDTITGKKWMTFRRVKNEAIDENT